MKTEILAPNSHNIRLCADYLIGGGVVAFPTETVYGLGADAMQPDAVREVFRVKGRPADNPLIVHIASVQQLREVAAQVSTMAELLINAFMPGAITLLLKKNKYIPDCVTAGLDTVGVRMPSHAVCRAFLQAADRFVCAPSANTSTRPSPTLAEHVRADLDGKIPYILDGGACDVGLESTIIDVSGGVPRLLRAGGIPRETIEEVLGCRVQTAQNSKVALCPGMKYKHYAPRAEVYTAACGNDMHARIIQKYDDLTASGRRTVVLCLTQHTHLYGQRAVYDMGRDYKEFAHNLFAALRKADSDGYDAVLIEGVPQDGIGAAIYNRIKKSSGGNAEI